MTTEKELFLHASGGTTRPVAASDTLDRISVCTSALQRTAARSSLTYDTVPFSGNDTYSCKSEKYCAVVVWPGAAGGDGGDVGLGGGGGGGGGAKLAVTADVIEVYL